MNLDGIQAPAEQIKPDVQEKPEGSRGKFLDFDSSNEWGDNVRFVEPGDKVEDEPVEEVEEADEEPEIEEEVEQIPLVDDPGEFVAKDYSFDVTLYDGEGKNGRVVNVTSPEQWDQLIAQDPNFGNASALLKAQRSISRMDVNMERDRADWQKSKDEFEEYSQNVEQQSQALETMASEIEYLVGKGDLPRVANQFKNADWQDPEVAKQNGVKEQIELLSYMNKENKARLKAGLKPMSSVLDAYNAFQLDNTRRRASDGRTVAAKERKEAGARVAGTTPNPVNVAPRGIAVGRVGTMAQSEWTI